MKWITNQLWKSIPIWCKHKKISQRSRSINQQSEFSTTNWRLDESNGRRRVSDEWTPLMKKKIKRQRRKWSIEYKKRNKKRRNGIKYGPPLRLNAVGGDCGRVIGQHASVARVRAHIKRRATSQRIAFYIAYCGQDDTWPPTLRPPLSLGLTGAVP